ncbi:seipin isoform X3 [Bombyx mori]
MGICSFPYAYVQLTRKSSILMSGQLYRIRLILEMPESNVNKDLGMFMVCTQMRAKGGVLVSSSCRSTMLRYRSKLHEYIRTAVMAPLLMSDVVEEKQTIQVDLFTEFDDDPNQPVTDAYVELQSRYVQVYGGQLHIEAHFTGLRYLMYNWPKFSALFGISTNLFFITLVFALSWYHLQEGLPEFIKSKLGTTPDKDEDNKKLIGKIKLEKEGKKLWTGKPTVTRYFTTRFRYNAKRKLPQNPRTARNLYNTIPRFLFKITLCTMNTQTSKRIHT